MTFAGVLVLSGGLLFGLFQSVGAVDIFVTDQDDDNIQMNDEVTFTVTVTVPEDERLPVSSVRAVVEETEISGVTDGDQPDFSAKEGAEDVAAATCKDTVGPGLPNCSQEDLTDTLGDAITSIEFVGGSPSDLPGYGYETCTVCHVNHTGYRFTGGYGYGYIDADLHGDHYQINDVVGGYGYNNGDLELYWDVTVDASELNGVGHYWLTFMVQTGSSVISDLEGSAYAFDVVQPVTGGPGGGGGGGGDGGVPGSGANAPPIIGEPGESFDVKVDGKVHITNLPAGFSKLGVTFNQDCDGCSIEFDAHSARPSSLPNPMDTGFDDMSWFSIDVHDANGNVLDGYVNDDVFLEFEVDQGDLDEDDQPGHVTLLHHTNPWEAEPTELVSDADADPLVYNATIRGFSEFATATDEEPPSITDMEPSEPSSLARPTISASFADNRGIDTSSFVLLFNGEEVTSEDGTLTVDEDGFTFAPAEAVTEDTHAVEATIMDESGWEATETWSFQVQDIECDPAPDIVSVTPADGAEDVAMDATITATVQEGECAIEAFSMTVDGEEIDAAYDAGELRASLPDTVEAGETVTVTASVTDSGDNPAQREWSFTTSDEGAPPVDPDPDDGMGTTGWLIVGLILLAIVGVAAYFATQREA